MSKPTKNGKRNKAKQEQSYLLVWHIEFTLLEEYIVKILGKMHHCSDEQISQILGIEPEDVDSVVRDNGLHNYVQGDNSRRTLIDDFTKMEYAEVKKNDKGSIIGLESRRYFEKGMLNEYDCTEISYKDVPKELEKTKAHKYYRINKT